MREIADRFKLGSEAFNRDVADIKWLVATLKGILEDPKISRELPGDFHLYAPLCGDAPTGWGVEFALMILPMTSPSRARHINVRLRMPPRGVQFPDTLSWEEVRWGIIKPTVPVEVVARMAENLDLLFGEVAEKLFVYVGPSASNILDSLLQRGVEEEAAQELVS